MYVIHRDCGSVSGFARAGGQRDREKERERGRRDGGGEADCSTLCGVRCFYKQIGSGPSRISRLPSPRDRETLPILFSKPEFPPPSSRTRLPGEEVEKISGTRKIHRYAHRSRGGRGTTSIREESFGDDLSWNLFSRWLYLEQRGGGWKGGFFVSRIERNRRVDSYSIGSLSFHGKITSYWWSDWRRIDVEIWNYYVWRQSKLLLYCVKEINENK